MPTSEGRRLKESGGADFLQTELLSSGGSQGHVTWSVIMSCTWVIDISSDALNVGIKMLHTGPERYVLTLSNTHTHTHLARCHSECSETRGGVVKVKSYYNNVTWLSWRSPPHNPCCCWCRHLTERTDLPEEGRRFSGLVSSTVASLQEDPRFES